ncbi:hypothetical protein NIES2135_25750 [Leptolyngbya boryana NIES-2135]|uniref:Uncharacterized protein n=1 Tax=Leptolyngbya boryana NIES-2135 TaxID=1973484 RepID=A0A1Z4JG94_LEPBY|nr:hypothetical protein NIES2135_25750 [Leptolyngbya boryana NIES-2135]
MLAVTGERSQKIMQVISQQKISLGEYIMLLNLSCARNLEVVSLTPSFTLDLQNLCRSQIQTEPSPV